MRTWTDEQLTEAVKLSTNYAEVMRNLNLKPRGSNYSTVKRSITRLELDVTHFYGQAWRKGKVGGGTRKPIEEFLVFGHTNTSHLKNRLIKEELLERKCYGCLNVVWQGQPIPLELEHKDGVNENNVLDNLTLLCPNCHALTETYRGKNVKVRANRKPYQRKSRATKIDWPSNEELLDRLAKSNYSAVGRELGVSDNAVRKRLSRGCGEIGSTRQT